MFISVLLLTVFLPAKAEEHQGTKEKIVIDLYEEMFGIGPNQDSIDFWVGHYPEDGWVVLKGIFNSNTDFRRTVIKTLILIFLGEPGLRL